MKNKKDLQVKIYQKQNSTRLATLFGDTIKDFFGSHFLALQLAKRDISAQYRQSYLGIVWLFITPLADVTIFVLRYGYTDKALLNFIKDVDQAGKIKNIVTVLNGITRNNTYGYGYNYSYNNYGYSYGYKNSNS